MNHSRYMIILIAMSLPLTGACIDIHAPSLPAIVAYFHTTQWCGQLSISLYLVGLSLGIFFIGTVSDFYSPRKLYIISTLLFMLSCLSSVFSPSIKVFLLTRFLQGFTVSGASTVAKRYLGVLFVGDELKKVTASVSVFWALGPILAPVLGGYIEHYLSWQFNFIFLAGYAVVILILSIKFLPKKTREVEIAFDKTICLSRWKMILSSRKFIGITVFGAMIYAIPSVSNIVTPFIIQKTLSKPATTFGHVGLLLGVCWFLGSALNRQLLNTIRSQDIVVGGLFLLVLIGVVMGVMLTQLPVVLLTVVLPLMLFYFIGGGLLSYGLAMSISIFPGLEGGVIALRASMTVLLTSGFCLLAGHLSVNNPLELIGLLTVMMAVAFVFYWSLGRGR